MNQLLVFCVRRIPTILSIVEAREVLVSVTDLHFLASRRVALLVAKLLLFIVARLPFRVFGSIICAKPTVGARSGLGFCRRVR